jgi:hypothetical protein
MIRELRCPGANDGVGGQQHRSPGSLWPQPEIHGALGDLLHAMRRHPARLRKRRHGCSRKTREEDFMIAGPTWRGGGGAWNPAVGPLPGLRGREFRPSPRRSEMRARLISPMSSARRTDLEHRSNTIPRRVLNDDESPRGIQGRRSTQGILGSQHDVSLSKAAGLAIPGEAEPNEVEPDEMDKSKGKSISGTQPGARAHRHGLNPRTCR